MKIRILLQDKTCFFILFDTYHALRPIKKQYITQLLRKKPPTGALVEATRIHSFRMNIPSKNLASK
jgi:hypothetical protein